jgi:hypothetical protein
VTPSSEVDSPTSSFPLVPPPSASALESTYTSQIRSLASALPASGRLTRGYEQEAVDAFVAKVCGIVEDLARRLREQQTELDTAWAELNARRNGFLADNSLSGPTADLLISQQRAAMRQTDDVVRAAAEQSRLTVVSAQEQAAAVLAAAQAQAETIDGQTRARLAAIEALIASMLEWVRTSATNMTGPHPVFHPEPHRLQSQPAAWQPGPSTVDTT